MELSEHVRQAWESISDHPRRIVASAMGVFWGAAAIVVLLAAGEGFRIYMMDGLTAYGQRMMFVIPGVTSSGFPGYRDGVPVRIGRTDLEVAERAHPELIRALLPEHRRWDERSLVEAGPNLRRLDLTAVDERFAPLRNFAVEHGRFFDAREVARGRTVAVLGYEAAEDLFGDAASAVERRIRVDGVPFTVVGVAAKKGQQYFNTNRPDNRVLIIPITTAEDRFGYDPRVVEWIYLFPREGAEGPDALRAALATLAPRAGFHPDDEDAVRYFDLTNILGLVDLMSVGFSVFIAVAGTVTLLVGGVGIANFHLATLAERTVEIGVCKALGARDSTLVWGTVIESLIVSGTTALLGVFTGIGVTLLLGALASEGGVVPRVSRTDAAIIFTALFGVAVVASLVPALRVRHMEISAALRTA